MADAQVTAGGQEVKIYSSGGAAAGPTPIVVSSGTRPLQISSSSTGGASIVDGVAEVKSPPTPITVFPAAAVATPVTVAPASGGIVIRSGSSAVAQQQAPPPTSPSTSATIVNGVSSGITIRSSASVVTAESVKGEPSRNVVAATGAPVAGQVSAAEPSTPSRTIIVNQGTTTGSGLVINTAGYPSAASLSHSPSESTAAASTPQARISSGAVDRSQNQQQQQVSNDVLLTSPGAGTTTAPASAASTPPVVIRAQTVTAGRSRPKSAVVADQPQQPPMTWSEFSNRFDLATVCGFTLAVFAIAFASILAGDDLPFGWLLTGVSIVSIALFVKLRL